MPNAAATGAAAVGWPFAPLERLAGALENPVSRDRAAAALIAAYVVAWTLYGTIAKSSQYINFDMAELFAWSRHPALGYPKHPPLAAWEASLWFAVLPRADWAYYLLAMLNVGVGLWAAWRIATRVLDPRRCALALVLLSFIPLLNFQALKFTPNVVLIPTWALTTLFLLRSLDTRRPLDATLAGIAAGAAMLTKYWSIYLLLGLAIAVLCDSRRRAYFKSPAPWITVAAGFAVLAPHLAWLTSHDFGPIGYAAETYGVSGFAHAARTTASYVLGAAAYVALPVVLGISAMRPKAGASADTLWPRAGERRTLALAFWLPLLLPALVTLATGGRATALWTMGNWALLPVVLLSSTLVEPDPRRILRAIAVALCFPLVLLPAAPFVAVGIHHFGVPHAGAHYRRLAREIEHAWSDTTAQPLRIVGGQSDVAYGAAFYLPGPPLVFADLDPKWAPWIDDARVRQDGMALVCPFDNSLCVSTIEAYAATKGPAHRFDVDLVHHYLGMAGDVRRFVIITVPPQP